MMVSKASEPQINVRGEGMAGWGSGSRKTSIIAGGEDGAGHFAAGAKVIPADGAGESQPG